MRLCSFCEKPSVKIWRGYCPTCFARFKRNGTPEPLPKPPKALECEACGKSGVRIITGLCAACYQRKWKSGSVEYTRTKLLCSVEGCDNLAHGHGLCNMHAMRKRRTGSLADPKPANRSHILYESWRWIRRNPHNAIWDDFWRFVADVGERPNILCRLVRIDPAKEFGPDNFHWRERIAGAIEATTRAEYARKFQVAYRQKRPAYFRDHDFRRHYSISLADYERKLAEQNGVCAICGSEETSSHPRLGKFSLAVDHCHSTGIVRGLLCSHCNRGLGLFNENRDTLRKAIAYLEKHESAE